MTNQWFRSWHGAPTDPKWLGIARKAGVAPGIVAAVVWALLDRASQASIRGSIAGYDADGIACFMGCEPEHVEAIISLMHDKGILTDEAFTGWEKHQPKREDGAAERAKEWRERKRTQANASEPPQTLDTDTDTEEDIIGVAPKALDKVEVSKPCSVKALKPLADVEPEGFGEFWAAYPKRDGNADRKGALKSFGPAVTRAGHHDLITRAASRYATHCRDKGKIGTEFVKQARSWLNGDLWREWLPQEPTRPASTRIPVHEGTPAWDAWKATGRRFNAMDLKDETGRIVGRGWYFESEFPKQETAAA